MMTKPLCGYEPQSWRYDDETGGTIDGDRTKVPRPVQTTQGRQDKLPPAAEADFIKETAYGGAQERPAYEDTTHNPGR